MLNKITEIHYNNFFTDLKQIKNTITFQINKLKYAVKMYHNAILIITILINTIYNIPLQCPSTIT